MSIGGNCSVNLSGGSVGGDIVVNCAGLPDIAVCTGSVGSDYSSWISPPSPWELGENQHAVQNLVDCLKLHWGERVFLSLEIHLVNTHQEDMYKQYNVTPDDSYCGYDVSSLGMSNLEMEGGSFALLGSDTCILDIDTSLTKAGPGYAGGGAGIYGSSFQGFFVPSHYSHRGVETLTLEPVQVSSELWDAAIRAIKAVSGK